MKVYPSSRSYEVEGAEHNGGMRRVPGRVAVNYAGWEGEVEGENGEGRVKGHGCPDEMGAGFNDCTSDSCCCAA